VNFVSEKNELEQLFIESVEEVRKEIMKRRLKNELSTRKKIGQVVEREVQEVKEFEESLMKLASLTKNRIKISDFTIKDKTFLIDLFVNNENVLLKMYEFLFPNRANTQKKGTYEVSTNKIEQFPLEVSLQLPIE